MQKMYKIYCRTFQQVMKIGMNFLPWRTPEVLEGPNSICQLPAMIKKDGLSKVMIVTGKNVTRLGLFQPMLDALDQAEIQYVIFNDLQPNPTDLNVEDGVETYRKTNCQGFIAFGGGSPMDCCKAIAASAATGKPVRKLQGLFRVLRPIPAIYAVPTTAGTGSETTIASVITDSTTHRKASINDTRLIPRAAVLDPTLTIGLPPSVTATTGFDALCHAVEAYTNNTYNTSVERKMAENAVRLIYENLELACLDGSNLIARQNMQKAAFYAGRAFTRGCVGYVHAIGHTLGGLYGTAHGLAMAVILPHVMRQFGSSAHKHLARLTDVCGLTAGQSATADSSGLACGTAALSDAEKAEAFISWMEDLQKKLGIPSHLDFIKDEDIPQMISWASKEANPLYPVPEIWGEADFQRCIRSVRGW